jgi:hypothetical protein
MDRRDADREVLASMRLHGSDLRKPAHTIHFLDFKTIDAANAAAEQLRAAAFQKLRVHRAPTTSLWKRLFGPRGFVYIAETHVVPEESTVFAPTDRLNALAAKLGGEYDGWEAALKSDPAPR